MKAESAFGPLRDIPDLGGRTIIVTGGTAGLGKEAILAFSRHSPQNIYLTGRNAAGAAQVIQEVKAINTKVNVRFLECDQTSLKSVESAIKRFLSETERLDILLCNAGVMGKDASLTKDGYEYQFGINHMAHALMIKMLLPVLRKTGTEHGDARIVFASSVGFRWTPSGGIVFKDLKTTQDYWFAGRWVRYGQSKLANVIYADEISRRYPEITSVSVHPGVIWTNLWDPNLSLLNRFFVHLATLGQAVPIKQGIHNNLWAATTKKERISPGFYEPVGVVGAQSKCSQDKELKEKLWSWTQKELEAYGERDIHF